MAIEFVTVRDFTPNLDLGAWTPIGAIASLERKGKTWTLRLAQADRSLQVSFLSETCFRVRFNPAGADYSEEHSFAVVRRELGRVRLKVFESSDQALVVDTGRMQVRVDLQPYRVRVFRGEQLIHADEPNDNLIYIPGQRVIANFKTLPENAKYCGFGEKAGAQLLKNSHTMTHFNFDNYAYVSAPLPPDRQGGPLDSSEALYTSIPFFMEINPKPVGDYQGPAYAYGIFFDNLGQTYFNMSANDYSDMNGKCYFGGLFGDMDYYFFLGDSAAEVLNQYTQLTGRSSMPPKYVFGFHQGCYGYYDRARLEAAANGYRAARIPIDGLHIDIDFQNNYRNFTHSERKFPNAKEMMAGLHQQGFKCSTDVTPLLTTNPLDENGNLAPYEQRQALLAIGGLIYDIKAGEGLNSNLFVGTVNYGLNRGVNPYSYPPLTPNRDGATPLSAQGNYPDFGRADVQEAWGEQYAHFINDLGMDMIWQDMICPALMVTAETPFRTFPLDLMISDGRSYLPNAVIHNAYALLLLKATHEGVTRLRPDRRTFIIARSGYAGVQRYAGVWTGDSAASWDFLRINIPEVLNLGISGVPISGCDIGGFATGTRTISPSTVNPESRRVEGGITNHELFTRWMQLGSFLPWFRNHYDGYNKQFQEVYAYGEPVLSCCRKYVELRYRMLQVYYDAMYEWTETGMPIARPLFLNDSDDPEVYNHLDDEFFVGKDFLVAPIVTQCLTLPEPAPPARDVYLPAGSEWYAFKDNADKLDAPVAGGQTLRDCYADLDAVPIFVRAGAILPMRSLAEQYVGELARNPLEITIYPGPDGQYRLYQDDGITTNAMSKREYRTTQISHRTSGGTREVRVRRLVDNFTPPEDFYCLAFLGSRRPSSVVLGSEQLSSVNASLDLGSSTSSAYYWDERLETVFIKVFDTEPDVTVAAVYG